MTVNIGSSYGGQNRSPSPSAAAAAAASAAAAAAVEADADSTIALACRNRQYFLVPYINTMKNENRKNMS